MRECDLLLEIGDLSTARRRVDTVLRFFPEDYRASLRSRFISYLDTAVVEELLLVARYHCRAGRYLPSRMVAVRAAQLQPFHSEVLVVLQRSTECLELNRKGRLTPLLSHLMAERYCDAARAALAAGDLHNAQVCYKRALLERPFDEEAMEGLALCILLADSSSNDLAYLGRYLFDVDQDVRRAELVYRTALTKDKDSDVAQRGYIAVQRVVLEMSWRCS